jgi:hypothetical protein
MTQRLAGSGVAKLGGSVGRAAGPAVLGAMAVASAPLAGQPKIVRDTVGWIALWTAFLSFSLWTYLLFFHKPDVPHTDSSPIEIVGQGGASVPGRGTTEHPSSEATADADHSKVSGH